MHVLRTALITGVLLITLIAVAIRVGTSLDSRLDRQAQVAFPVGQSHQAVFYVGYDPGLWCTVGEQRALGLSLMETASRQSTRLFAIPLGT